MTKTLQKEFLRFFPKRKGDTHKGDYGHVVCICGSRGMTGAAYLSAGAALRSGAGLVTVIIPASLNSILAVKLSEAMTSPIDDKEKGFLSVDNREQIMQVLLHKDAVAIGPGLCRNNATTALVRSIYEKIEIPLVLDADGLNAFVGYEKKLHAAHGNVVITPHEGEFERLFGIMQGTREKRALKIARERNLFVVLKGAHTVVASPCGEIYVNDTGNPGMATGGTGDCLCGIIASFLAQKIPLFNAAKLAVFLHGFAGDLAAKKYGEISLIATDLLSLLPEAFPRLRKERINNVSSIKRSLNVMAERYSRQRIDPAIGIQGQNLLAQAKVLIVGVGGLGSSVALYLAAAGVGTLGLVDHDVVQESNLNRQVLYGVNDLTCRKVRRAAECIGRVNPDIALNQYDQYIDETQARRIFTDYDIIIDATDNFSSKFMLNDVCVAINTTLIHAGAQGFVGQIMVIRPGTSCLRCFMPEMPKEVFDGASPRPILGVTAGLLGQLQATETIKCILKLGDLLVNKILFVDLLKMQFKTKRLVQNRACPACSQRQVQ